MAKTHRTDEHPKHRQKNNESPRSSDSNRTGNQFYSGGLCARERGGQSLPFRAIAASPQTVQQFEAINLKFDEAFNKHDATAVGAEIKKPLSVMDHGQGLLDVPKV